MSTFDEKQVRRSDDGRFAEKPAAAEAGVELGEQPDVAGEAEQGPHQRRGAARDALDRFDVTSGRFRDPGSMRNVRANLEHALVEGRDGSPAASDPARAEAMTLAAAMVRERSGMDAGDAHTYMRGVTPHLSDDEVRAFTHESKIRMDAAAVLQETSPGEVGELMNLQRHDAERVVAVSDERGNPAVTIEAAPVPSNSDVIEEYSLAFDDPGVADRRRERSEIMSLADSPAWGSHNGSIDPANLSSEKLKDSRSVSDVSSVLVQRGMHPRDAEAAAVRITRAASLSTWYAEGGADSVTKADHYDFSRRGAAGHEPVVAVGPEEFATSETEVSRAYGGGYEAHDEAGVDHDSWAGANSDAWGDTADDELRTALGHPKFRRN